MSIAEKFPTGLLRWSGYREGGVKKPFRSDSGRPAGKRFNTPLIARLSEWIEQLITIPESAPRLILLVGGPGNGKTDAVESCIEKFDCRLNANGKLFEAFAKRFSTGVNQVLPRSVSVYLPDILPDLPPPFADLHHSCSGCN